MSETSAPASSPAHAEALPVDDGNRDARDAREDADDAPIPLVDDDAGASPARRRMPLIAAAAAALFLLFVLPPLSSSGLWDPYELNIADLARRMALNLFGAADLALSGADNSLPHLNDLGRPQLPFSSIALGFRMFGLHEWAGRLPLAVWGFAGVMATYGFVARLIDRRAGLFSAVALMTMPLYLVQARTMMGDIVTMSALAMAFGGLAVAVFDRDVDGPKVSAVRLAWLAVAIVGIVSGFYSRGGILGVGVPALGVGLAWLVTLGFDARKTDMLGNAVGGVALVLGATACYLGAVALSHEKVADLNPWIGAMVKTQGKYPTFDFYIGHIGHALVPWSAFAPFALGRLFIAPAGRRGAVFDRESFTRVALLLAASVALVAHGFLAARTDLIAFTGPALLAAACGIAVRDFERGAHASIAVGVGTLVFLGVFHHDFHEIPDKAYQVFAITGAVFPESFKEEALTKWWVTLGFFAVVSLFTWLEKDAKREPFAPSSYVNVAHELRTAWDGLLALSYFALVAGASLAGLVVWLGLRFKWKFVGALSLQLRDGVLNAWWVTALVPLAIIFGIYFASDVFLWTFNRARPLGQSSLSRGFEPFEAMFRAIRQKDQPAERNVGALILFPLMVLAVPGGIMAYLIKHGTRAPISVAIAVPSGIALFLLLGIVGDLFAGKRAGAIPAAGLIVGVILSMSYYPALANQLSPKEVFETYQRVHSGAEPLGLFGVGGRTAAYYAGGQPPSFNDTQSAEAWLLGGGSERRFLAVKAEELPKLNAMYRDQTGARGEGEAGRTNLPVVDARSSQILLVSSTLGGSDKNQNPLDKILLSKPPQPQHKLDVNMDDKLACLGYDLTDQQGRLIDVVAPGRKYRMRTYYQVLAPLGSEWEAFIHIDGFKRRHNGDHKPVAGKYPMTLWGKGDFIVDDYEFALEPNFTPGSYTVFFGLFAGETRLKVKSGPSDGDNRVNGGTLRVQ